MRPRHNNSRMKNAGCLTKGFSGPCSSSLTNTKPWEPSSHVTEKFSQPCSSTRIRWGLKVKHREHLRQGLSWLALSSHFHFTLSPCLLPVSFILIFIHGWVTEAVSVQTGLKLWIDGQRKSLPPCSLIPPTFYYLSPSISKGYLFYCCVLCTTGVN